jgi:cell division protein FtsI (penicillin-binding protein 3)
MSVKKDIIWRVALVYTGILLLGLCIIARIIYLQFVEVGALTQKAIQLSIKDIEIEPNRGDILACDGRLLATAVPYYEIRTDMSNFTVPRSLFAEKVDSLAMCLSKLFKDKSKSSYKRELTDARKTNNRYLLVKRKVDYQDLKQLKTFPIFRLGKNKGGLIVIQNNVRFLPYGDLAARTIGYLTKNENGNIVGIEGSFNEDLKGVKGVKLMQRLSGNVWMPVNDENEVEPQDGYDVVTTIDLNIQDVAEEALRKQLMKHNAHHGTAILMEVQTGQVKAIANLERDEDGTYRELYNYGIAESTEPGSTFKLASLMAAMEDGYVDLEDTIDTQKGSIKIYDKEIHDSYEKGYGLITVKKVFEVSSNVGVAKIIMKNYQGREEQFIKRIYGFGLNKQMNLDIKGEGAPYIKFPGDKLWSGISLPMIAHGYEVRLTPLQILSFYNAVANNGKLVKPRFVNELRFHGQTIKTYETEVLISSICSMSTIRKARAMLEGVVENGTALNLLDSSLRIAGKTGTAQIAKQKLGYRQDARISYQASFAGYFPADDPKYSCIVVVNAPSNDVYYGNLVAGPVFKEIAQKVNATSFALHNELITGRKHLKADPPAVKGGSWDELEETLDELGIGVEEKSDKTSNWVSASKDKDESEIDIYNKTIIKNLVPDVKGMGAKDAVFLLESAGLRVVIKGYGKVTTQSLSPGIRAEKGKTIVISMG